MRARTAAQRKNAPDLNRYFRVRFPDGADLDGAAAALRKWPDVAKVFRVPVPTLPTAPDYLDPANGAGTWQRYVDAAPDGVDARYAWSNGFDGADIAICDVEYDWNENHVDLPVVSNLVANHQDPGYGDDHGTAVLGELAGKPDGAGVRGIASGATFYFAGAYADGSYNLGDAVLAAVAALGPGGVVLLEQQITGPNGTYVYVVDEQGVARMRPVTTAHTAAGRWVVDSGIAAGDRVIVEGLPKVRPNTPVKVVAAAQPQQ